MGKARKQTFGDLLCELRTARGLTWGALAERCDFHYDTIRKLERGDREPSLRLAKVLARVLGITLDELAAPL